MIYFSLFITFFKIGCLAFGGGYAVIPLIQQYVVEDQAWLTEIEMRDLVSISQMTPGPIAINSATFVGTKISNLLGSLAATIGIVLPAFLLLMLLSRLIFGDRDIKLMDYILAGIRPGIIGLIFIAALDMFRGSVYQWSTATVQPVALACFVLGFGLRLKKLSVTKLIILGAGLGILLSLI